MEPAARGEVVMPGCDWLSAHVLLRVGEAAKVQVRKMK